MASLTIKEKADCFDRLVKVFKYTKEAVNERKRLNAQRYSDISEIGAYNKGMLDGMHISLKSWKGG